MRISRLLCGLIVILCSTVLLAGCSKSGESRSNLAALAVNSQNVAQQNLVVKFLDIGQGDAILIKTANQVNLVDSGDVPAREKLVEYIQKDGIKTIDNIIITHPHADHIGGMKAVFEKFTVKNVYDSGQFSTSQLYKQYLTTIKEKNIPFKVVSAGMSLDLGQGITLKFFGPVKPFITGTNSDANNNSIVGKLIFNDFSLMLTGDAEQQEEAAIFEKHSNELRSSILKSGHHGSNTASSMPFLQAVSPEAAIISCGIDNPYHHPHPSTIKKYELLKLKVFITAQSGTITVTSDGKTYSINKER